MVQNINDFYFTPADLGKILGNHEGHPSLACQCWAAFELLSENAKKANSSLDDLVKITVYLKKSGHFEIFDEVASKFLNEENLPALECVLIPNPGPVHDAVVQIEAIGFRN